MPSEWVAAAIGAAAAIGGGLLGGAASKKEASRLRDWQADQYSRRYRITMHDMRAAGLNPILAARQGPGQSPSGAMGNQGQIMGNAFGQAGGIISQGAVRAAQTDDLKASERQRISQVQLNKTQGDLNREKIGTERQRQALMFQQAIREGAAAELDYQKIRQSRAEIERIKKQTGFTEVQIKQALVELEQMKTTGKGHAGQASWTAIQILRTLIGIGAEGVRQLRIEKE